MTIQVIGKTGSKGLIKVSEIAALLGVPAAEVILTEDDKAYTRVLFKSGTTIDVLDSYEELEKIYLEALVNDK